MSTRKLLIDLYDSNRELLIREMISWNYFDLSVQGYIEFVSVDL